MNNKPIFGCLLVFALLPACRAQEALQGQQAQAPPIEVHFSPKGGCTEAVVKELGNAKKMLLVQAYSFTSAPIAKALVDAHKRGVKVEVILDKSQRTEKYSSADFLHNMGVPVKIDAQHQIAHNKIMVIDANTIIQLHESSRRIKRRKPVCDSGHGLGGQVHRELASPCGALRALRGQKKGILGDAAETTRPGRLRSVEQFASVPSAEMQVGCKDFREESDPARHARRGNQRRKATLCRVQAVIGQAVVYRHERHSKTPSPLAPIQPGRIVDPGPPRLHRCGLARQATPKAHEAA